MHFRKLSNIFLKILRDLKVLLSGTHQTDMIEDKILNDMGMSVANGDEHVDDSSREETVSLGFEATLPKDEDEICNNEEPSVFDAASLSVNLFSSDVDEKNEEVSDTQLNNLFLQLVDVVNEFDNYKLQIVNQEVVQVIELMQQRIISTLEKNGITCKSVWIKHRFS